MLDSEPLNDYDGRLGVGPTLAVTLSQVREHSEGGDVIPQQSLGNHRG